MLMQRRHTSQTVFAICICVVFLCLQKINCLDVVGVEHDKTNEDKWSLANLNPLSWLFPSKSDNSKIESLNLPISRRAGLSDTNYKNAYNDLTVDRDKKDGRKRRRKPPPSLLQGPRRRNKLNNRFRERRRRKRRKHQAQNRRFRQNKAPYYKNKKIFSSNDDYEQYYDETELTFSESRDPNQHQDNKEHDLVMSDYDLRNEEVEPRSRPDDEEDINIYEEEYDYPSESSERKKRNRQSTSLGGPPRLSTSRRDLTFFGQGIGRPSAGCVCRCDCCDCCPCQEGDLIYVDK